MTIKEASTLPDRELREELVLVYFCHVHPLCPFIDEYSFCEVYYMAETDEDLLAHIDIGLFQSRVFVAFTVRSFHLGFLLSG